jgi:flagellar L-ring protein precursor FlgH
MDPSVVMGDALTNQITAKRNALGNGQANQSNSLTGSISVSVVEVLPNGNLKVRGEKRVSLNQGNEYLRVSGIIRPIDISATNTVSSSQLADATIMYTGDGAVADASRMGWISRSFFSWLFPF